jgi:hypothetical protein
MADDEGSHAMKLTREHAPKDENQNIHEYIISKQD